MRATPDPDARQVVAAVQRSHPRFQRLTLQRRGQRIPIRADHHSRAAAMDPKPAVTIGSYRRGPYRAIVLAGAPYDAGLKAN
jgi:hypothetical protein